ncbi:hypothetical protein [Janthinobacterium sp. RB2P8]|uniref:hypothetical protein n=1 Tax=Janthinobacterium sp. RB2P8 TaxID=3424191 RepID=UPI003F272AF1
MSLNINNKSAVVNKQNEEFNYFSLNKKVFNELVLTSRPKLVLYQIISYLACTCTYKNGLVGIHSEMKQATLCKALEIDRRDLAGYLKQLETMSFIKIFNTSPLVLQVLEVPQAPRINDIKGLLLYVHTNPQQFNFHRNLKRKTAFFETFKEYNSQILVEKMKKAEVPADHQPTEQEPDDYDPFGFK